MKKPFYTYPVSSKQDLFCRSRELVTGFCAGRGSGKSHIGALRVIERAKNGQRWDGGGSDLHIKGTRGTDPRVLFRTQDGGTAQMSFRSADNPERFRGPSLAGLWLDEASLMHEDAFLLGSAMLRHEGLLGMLSLTFTPRGRRHWTFKTFYQEIPSDEVDEDDSEIAEIGGSYYRPRANTLLVRAHTLENPFAPPEYYEQVRSHYTSALAAQELAGEFVDLAGLIFKAEWFSDHYADVPPRMASRVRYWDRAATHGSGCFSAGCLMSRTPDGLFYIEDMVRGQWSYQERNSMILETARKDAGKYNNEVMIVGEQEGGSAGKEISEQFIRMLSGYPVFRDIVSGKRSRVVDNVELPGEAKVVRARPLAAQCEAGNVYIVQGPWNDEFILELTGFPDYAFSDQVDGTSGAFNKLANLGVHDPGEISRPEVEQETEHFGLSLVRSRARRRGL
jgi:predicted phage terminase large subunit-like protein